ncbi:MAG: DUF433 domain-containing protein [Bacteroidota bacterium]|nr:hypothetical protein [Odoribacter sp.]MDP3642723.1 DUF433 domain-containing protein [Bacteroidota bacterium]
MNWRVHIETNNQILAGKPVIKGTRLSVEHIINLLASGWTEQQILENYPRLSKESLQAVFGYVQEFLKDGLFYNEPLKSA